MSQPQLIPPLTAPVALQVLGTPIPQGSKTAYVIRGRAVLKDANAKTLKPWRERLRLAAVDATRYHDLFTGPVALHLVFTFDRPISHLLASGALAGRAPRAATSHGLGDLDKLQRAVLDALTDAAVWRDDAQVVDVRARKFYAGEHELALPTAGVRIQIQEAP